MIGSKSHPVDWALFLAELEDARSHLGDLMKELEDAGVADSPEFGVNLGHVMSHLNRAWHLHAKPGEIAEEDWERASGYHDDLRPV